MRVPSHFGASCAVGAVRKLAPRPSIADFADAGFATRQFDGDGDATAALRIVAAEEPGPLHRQQRRLVLALGIGVAVALAASVPPTRGRGAALAAAGCGSVGRRAGRKRCGVTFAWRT